MQILAIVPLYPKELTEANKLSLWKLIPLLEISIFEWRVMDTIAWFKTSKLQFGYER